jgi:hypothetical protein
MDPVTDMQHNVELDESEVEILGGIGARITAYTPPHGWNCIPKPFDRTLEQIISIHLGFLG